VKHDEAIELIRGAVVAGSGGAWADLGSGDGTFSRALAALIGPAGVVYAVDREKSALARLAKPRGAESAEIRTVVADFTRPLDLPRLHGVLTANALHYVPYDDQRRVVEHMAALVDPPGSLVVVEYERRNANPWVPYPIPFEPLRALAREAGLTDPEHIATRPSRYSGSIYSALVRLGT
jgi:SAM-dependent methyltransferase